MAIGKIKASRVNNVDAETYIGEDGILFYNYANGVVRISDGITPGGVPVPYTIASNTTIGGIKAGPGIVISNDGELFIDSANLALSFGNFTANNNILSIVNSAENMILRTANAEVQLVGNIGFYKSGTAIPSAGDKYFQASDTGQVSVFVAITDNVGAFNIVGGPDTSIMPPGTPGTMLHVTGVESIPARMYIDGDGDYVSFVGRRWNGNIAAPTQVLANDYVLRINSTAATNAGVGNVAMAQISTQALEDQTTTAQGSQITFTVTPIGQSAASRVDVANVTVANGVTATKFTTSGTVTATGNITTNGYLTGRLIRGTRNAGSIADGGTLTIDFSTDAVVYCTWANGMTLNYSNFTPGCVVKVMCTKDAGSGTDTLSLDGLTASLVSSGSTSIVGTAGTTTFIELTCVGTTIGSVYAKI